MARYGQAFKDREAARLLPPESAALDDVSRDVGINLRTLQRWKASDGLVQGDGRPLAVRPVPAHALSPAERAAVLSAANAPRFAHVPPARIVPTLADEGIYLASESAFARVLRANGQNAHRGRAKAPRRVKGPMHEMPREAGSAQKSHARRNKAG